MFRKIKGFTLAEVLLTLMIIGVLVAICVSSFFGSDGLSEKRARALSKDFYANISRVYPAILAAKSSNFDVTTLDKTVNGNTDLSGALNYHLANYLGGEEAVDTEQDGENGACSKTGLPEMMGSIYLPSSVKQEIDKTKYCFTTPQGIVAMVYVNTASNTYRANEVYKDTSYTNKTGYGIIIYSIKGAKKGVYGKDIFTIVLGKSQVK